MRSSSAFAVALFVMLALAPPGALADNHMEDEGLAGLLTKSAFAHGYLHGYEEGFSWGDRDLHMGRSDADPGWARRTRKVQSAYQRGFGDRRSFNSGFERGFVSGYVDAREGRIFRGVEELRLAAEGDAEVRPGTQYKNFDGGFMAGYESGNRSQLGPPNAPGFLQQAHQSCLKRTRNPMAAMEYCNGFARGYRLAFQDAALLRQSTPVRARR